MLKVLPDPHGFVCRLGLGTGLRWGELTRAQASDLERGCLVVHKTKSRKIRRVPLAPELLVEAKQHVGRLVGFSVPSPGSFEVSIRRATGIERLHAHPDATHLSLPVAGVGWQSGCPQQILGHASIETTQRYARISHDVVMSEAERLNGRAVAKVVATDSQVLLAP